MLSAIRRLFHRVRHAERERDYDDEISFHLQMDIDARVAAGTPPNEARRQAVAMFGSADGHKDGMRDARRAHWFEEVGRDARVALRGMRRAPAFTALVIVTLGIGIGASTAVWALIDGIVLRPLPYANADRLFLASEATSAGDLRPMSYQGFLDRKRDATTLDRFAFVHGEGVVVTERDGAQRFLSAYVTDDFFPALGMGALMGRTFAAVGAERPAVISWSMWQSLYGGSAGVVGSALRTIDGVYTIVGIMPRAFREPAWADFWLPFDALPQRAAYVRTRRNLHVDAEVIARLAPNSTLSQARAELSTIASRLARDYPDDAKGWTDVRLDAIRDNVLGDASVRLRLLALIVTLVLLVTCVNVAGLLVSRHAARSQELTLRAALGARRGRLLRQLIVESAVLALGGAVLGVAVAAFGLEALRQFAPSILPRIDEVRIGGSSLAFTIGVAAFATMLLGLLPAQSALRLDIAGSFKRGSVGAPRTRMRHALVVVQFAFALCTVVGSGLLTHSMMKLAEVRLGLDPEGVTAFRIFPPDRYAAPEAGLELYRRIREEVAAIPGVQGVALVNHVPFAGGIMTTRIQTRSTGNSKSDASEEAIYRMVSPDYLRVMGGTLKRGRYLTDADLNSEGSGIVVNEAFVKRFLGEVEALGEGVTFVKMAPTRSDLGSSLTGSVVGVVEDERIFGPAAPPSPTIYVPYTWNAWPNIYVTVRTASPMASIVPLLRRAILNVDAEIPVAGSSPQTSFRPITAYLDGALESRRMSAWALSIFGLVTVVLAGVGIFGVMAYLVLQSTREIGLRLALGSTPHAVRRWVLREALRLAALGIAGGVVIALAGVRFLRSQLAGVDGSDPVVYVFAAALFGMVALVSALLPAWRASRIDPMTMLRAD